VEKFPHRRFDVQTAGDAQGRLAEEFVFVQGNFLKNAGYQSRLGKSFFLDICEH
jgi:hypothetical protein